MKTNSERANKLAMVLMQHSYRVSVIETATWIQRELDDAVREAVEAERVVQPANWVQREKYDALRGKLDEATKWVHRHLGGDWSVENDELEILLAVLK